MIKNRNQYQKEENICQYTYANEADMLNAVLIKQGKTQKERMELLRQLAVQQLQMLEAVSLNNLPGLRSEVNN